MRDRSNKIDRMPPPLLNRRWSQWVGVVALLVITIFVYRPAWHGNFVWDDDRYVTNNRLLVAPDGLRRIWFSLDSPSQYFPLTYTVLRIGHGLWGVNPFGYHMLNILLHAANAVLVWWILSKLKVPGRWLAAAIFALHPVQVESVAWISELKNVLMAFFFLLTISAWIQYLDKASKRPFLFYGAALIFYFLALGAKSTACTLPAALLLILWLKEKPIGKRELLEIVPFVIMALGVGLVAIWWEKYHQGTRMLTSLAPVDRFLIASRAVWFYLSKIFWPSDLTFIYPKWRLDATDPRAYLWIAAIAAAAALILYLRRFLGRGPEVAAFFFVATLSPLLGFIMLYTFRYTFVADHYQYLASIGPIALAAAGIVTIGEKYRLARWFVVGLSAAILVCLSILTWRQSGTYRDAETLWRATIARNPACWMAYNNLGALQIQEGETFAAIDNYEIALRLNSDYPEAHYNLGSALLQTGSVDDAILHCKKALELQPNDPDAHVVLGNAFMGKQEIEQAIAEYETALKLRSDDPNAHYNLGMALQQKGETERAAREFERARQLETPP